MNRHIALALLGCLAVYSVTTVAEEPEAKPMPTVTGEAEFKKRLTKVGYQFQFGGPYRAAMRFNVRDGQLLVKEEYIGSGVFGKVEYAAKIVLAEEGEAWMLHPEYPADELSYIKSFGQRDKFQIDGKSLEMFTPDGKTSLAKPKAGASVRWTFVLPR